MEDDPAVINSTIFDNSVFTDAILMYPIVRVHAGLINFAVIYENK